MVPQPQGQAEQQPPSYAHARERVRRPRRPHAAATAGSRAGRPRRCPSTDDPAQPYQAPYQPYQHTTYARPRNPRKKGPILFWFTLALIATGVGTLGLIDVSGTAVPDAAYPALAMSLTGAMLLLGAFWGRAGGLIFIGLITAAATLGATATDNYDGKRLTYTPTSSAEVRDTYDMGAGELTLDLSQVDDVEGLDGHELAIDGGIGEIEVIVPDGMDVTVDATTGVGDVSVFGRAQRRLRHQPRGASSTAAATCPTCASSSTSASARSPSASSEVSHEQLPQPLRLHPRRGRDRPRRADTRSASDTS